MLSCYNHASMRSWVVPVEGGVMTVLGAFKHAANCLNIVLHDTWDIGLLEVEAEDEHGVSDQCALNSDS